MLLQQHKTLSKKLQQAKEKANDILANETDRETLVHAKVQYQECCINKMKESSREWIDRGFVEMKQLVGDTSESLNG